MLSVSQKNLLRMEDHRTKLYLSIYQPPIIWQAHVNPTPTPARKDYVITYYDVVQGSYLNVQAGMTVIIGTDSDPDLYGKLRVRSISATTITLAENADIPWVHDLLLTVVNFHEIWSVYPYLEQSGEDVIFYKDRDLAYTNQNSVLGTFICMGPHHAAFLENGVAQVYYSASGTSNLLGENITYAWEFQGSPTLVSSSPTPGYITYNTPGHYTTILTVTSASGAVDKSYRHVSIYDRPGEGTSLPVEDWDLLSLSGSREEGGYTARVRVRDALEGMQDGALVVIFADDWYGAQQISLGGNAEHREKIFFVGYIDGGSIRYDYANSETEFEVVSPTRLMQSMEGFSVSVESSAAPTAWYQLLNMTVRRAVYHYLRWHSTVLTCHDFRYEELANQNIEYFDADRTSLYDAVANLLNTARLGEFVCDRQGRMYAEQCAGAVGDGGSSLPYVTDLSKDDWVGQLDIQERMKKEVSYLELGGMYHAGPGNLSTPLLACAPGETPGYQGTVKRLSGLAVEDQDHLNWLAGAWYSWLNLRYPEVGIDLRGNYRVFDIAPQTDVLLTVQQGMNNRKILWDMKYFTPRAMSWSFDPDKQYLSARLTMAEVVLSQVGYPIPVPETPPDDGHEQPTPVVPPLPDPIPPPNPIALSLLVEDEGTFVSNCRVMDFVGFGVTADEMSLGNVRVSIPGGGGHVIEELGTPMPQRQYLDFVGSVDVQDEEVENRTVISIPGAHVIQNNGVDRTQREHLNFIGAVVTDDPANLATVVTLYDSNGHIIQDAGAVLTQRTYLNFVGEGVSVDDEELENRTVVTIPGKHGIRNNGADRTDRDHLNFIGAVVTDNPGDNATDITIFDSMGHIIQGTGVVMTQRSYLDFVGAGVIVSDEEIENRTVVSIAGAHVIQDEGFDRAQRGNLNFEGLGVSVTDDAAHNATKVTIAAGGHVIQEEGSPLPTEPNLNFVGMGVTVVDDAETEKTVVTIPLGHDIYDDGSIKPSRQGLNFIGNGVYLVDDAGNNRTSIEIAAGGHIIQDEGIELPAEPKLNFVGMGVTVIDDAEMQKTIVTIPKGHDLYNEAGILPSRNGIEFVGEGVTVTDDEARNRTVVEIGLASGTSSSGGYLPNFITPDCGFDGDDAPLLFSPSTGTIKFPDAYGVVWGRFRVPSDYSGSVTVHALFFGNPGGHGGTVEFSLVAYCNKWDGSAGNSGSEDGTHAFSEAQLYVPTEVGSATVTVGPGDIVECYFERSDTDGSGQILSFHGFTMDWS